MRLHKAVSLLLAALLLVAALPASPAWAAEKRIALVVGNAAYQAGPLATAANDAGLIAQTLQGAGFDVIGARDLDEDALRKSLRDFVDKAAAAGPDAVAFIYLAGYGLQLEGENYFAPIDLRVTSAADVALRALRVSDYTRSLAALPLKARFFVLDGARRAPFTVPGKPLAGGLALTEAEPGSLIAFNAAPGTVGPDEKGPYGAYAQALVEMIREGGLPPGPLFDRVRLRVDAATKGAEVPWDADRTASAFVFFDRAADAPALGRERAATLRDRPLRDLGVQDAYAVCLERDDLAHYQEFVTDYPGDALARRVRALIAARREALVWRRTWIVGTPDAYWSYLARYPRGPHAWDARRRLATLAAALEPPPRFAMIAYDVLPAPPDEIVYVDRPVLFLDDPVFALPPPPPPALVFLPPPPAYLVALAPPPPVYGLYALPTPPVVPVPAYVSAPAYVAPPPNDVLFQNIHNTTVIEQINRQNTGVQAPAAAAAPAAAIGGAGALAGAALGAAATRVALPAALQQRAVAAPPPGTNPAAIGGPAGPRPGGPQAGPPPSAPQAALPAVSAQPGAAHALPGANGQPLPAPGARLAPPAASAPAAAPRQAFRPADIPARTSAGPVRPQELRDGSGAPGQPPRGPAADRAVAARPSVDPRAALMAQQRQEALSRRVQAQAAQRQQQVQAARQQQSAQRQQQAAQRQQQAAVRQQQAQQAAQRHQAMQAQFAQQAAQRQQQAAARQQQAAQRQQMMVQRQQMMARPAPPHPGPAPHAGPPPSHGNPRPACPPGHPCR
ncbi:peptidase C14 [Methylobacterium mesophilicum SR1.6/6]|uniref:Peptidase C14 n=1 Tax=Methylobacterium mesophilicum SR1.6/6 TaxID=908290 RepID=A0A6B9FN46_9HYPH|nr:caspase domain-containing protein [Methylobacterium mesophilicum]QGY03432.1 peptidase C14 [Methylobacterium mesophilicum SR1.6/6]